jgi:predicted PhzF superfamily epimerase YddE/YHI9
VDEDPVTGSAHCELAPYWSKKLTKNNLKAKQLSLRTGEVECQLMGNRVLLSGRVVDYMRGKISL